ncbi:hypothetical protein OGATHE_003626 [Ogataea polymorpha]|uniref:Uncharacterized protein n=1 Tax=Ogataea polymorpha TaxID=460523 RepID=A0A9P8P4B7_9ASCO|nr:hypothetical protein OGATHE_003626 [Ogataea polymorpha]
MYGIWGIVDTESLGSSSSFKTSISSDSKLSISSKILELRICCCNFGGSKLDMETEAGDEAAIGAEDGDAGAAGVVASGGIFAKAGPSV